MEKEGGQKGQLRAGIIPKVFKYKFQVLKMLLLMDCNKEYKYKKNNKAILTFRITKKF